MAVIAKFKALRPVRDKVHLVATRPYYSYKKNVLKAKMETNPWTLLNIINPEFDHSKKTKANSWFNLLAANERLAAKLITIIPEIITSCSLDEAPDHTKKWGNKLQIQKSLRFVCA